MNFQVINEESPQLVDELVEGVRTFVHEQLGDETTLPLSVIARDDDGSLMGGVSGRTIYSNFLIGVVWVDKKYRGTGLGRKLMESAETQAIGRGCNTNQYKDVIAQREFSASEVRQRVRNIVVLRLSSLTQHQVH
jgi:GNAT superfamily N-acetyltransferase